MSNAKETKLLVFDTIKAGVNTLDTIAKELKLTKYTVCKITNELTTKKLIKIENHPENYSGRRTNYYSVNESFYSVYIEQKDNCFNCISIDIKGNVVKRFDFVMNNKQSIIENIKNMLNYLGRKQVFGKYCIKIFINCELKLENLKNDKISFMSKEDIIINCLSDKDKMILFTLNGKNYISAYDHLHYPQKGIGEKTILKALHIDKHYTFSDELYEGIFLSLSKYAYDNLHKLI